MIAEELVEQHPQLEMNLRFGHFGFLRKHERRRRAEIAGPVARGLRWGSLDHE